MKTKEIIQILRNTPLTAQFSVESFSKEINLSRSRFYTIVKLECDTTPECLIRRRRVEWIIEWIAKYPEKSTTAKLLDFARIGYFNDAKPLLAAFKSILGEHPFTCRTRLIQSENLYQTYNSIIRNIWVGLPDEDIGNKSEDIIIELNALSQYRNLMPVHYSN